MSGDIRGQRLEDLVCYEDSCVCKWAVVIRTQHRMSVSCGAPNRAWPSRRAIFSPQKQEISHGQSRPVGSAPQVQRVCFDGRIATIQKAGRRPLPSKTGGLQPPELPLALPSGHTWAPWGGTRVVTSPSNSIHSVLELLQAGYTAACVAGPALEI